MRTSRLSARFMMPKLIAKRGVTCLGPPRDLFRLTEGYAQSCISRLCLTGHTLVILSVHMFRARTFSSYVPRPINSGYQWIEHGFESRSRSRLNLGALAVLLWFTFSYIRLPVWVRNRR